MNLEEFELFCMNELQDLIEPILIGRELCFQIGLEEEEADDEKPEFIELIIKSLKIFALNVFAQNKSINNKRVDLFYELENFLGVSEKNEYTRDLCKSILREILGREADDEHSFKEFLKPAPVFYLELYDYTYDTKFTERIRRLFYNFAIICTEIDGSASPVELNFLQKIKDKLWLSKFEEESNSKSSLMDAPASSETIQETENENIDILMKRLNDLIGICSVKEEVQRLVNANKIGLTQPS